MCVTAAIYHIFQQTFHYYTLQFPENCHGIFTEIA